MSEPHERLDRAMKDRLLQIKKRFTNIANEAGISTAALGAIRRGEYRPSPLTARQLDDAFRWEHGSVDGIYEGHDPVPVGQDPEPTSPVSSEEPTTAELAEAVATLKDQVADLQERLRRFDEGVAESGHRDFG